MGYMHIMSSVYAMSPTSKTDSLVYSTNTIIAINENVKHTSTLTYPSDDNHLNPAHTFIGLFGPWSQSHQCRRQNTKQLPHTHPHTNIRLVAVILLLVVLLELPHPRGKRRAVKDVETILYVLINIYRTHHILYRVSDMESWPTGMYKLSILKTAASPSGQTNTNSLPNKESTAAAYRWNGTTRFESSGPSYHRRMDFVEF